MSWRQLGERHAARQGSECARECHAGWNVRVEQWMMMLDEARSGSVVVYCEHISHGCGAMLHACAGGGRPTSTYSSRGLASSVALERASEEFKYATRSAF